MAFRWRQTDVAVPPIWEGISLDQILVAGLLASILVAALTPRYLRSREATRVAATRALMRTTAAGIESYYLDHAAVPACGRAEGPRSVYEVQALWQPSQVRAIPTGVTTANSFARKGSRAAQLITFRLMGPGERFATLTTPVAYLDELPGDPFATTSGGSFGYFAHESNMGWILYSMGPDRDERAPDGPGDLNHRVERLYAIVHDFPHMWIPPDELIQTRYDPTNGWMSEGDIFWMRGD